MPLLKAGRVTADPWRALADDEPVPEAGAIRVSLARWQKERATLLGRGTPLGLSLKAGQHPAALAADLEHIKLIALEFAKFTDGRAYSYARLLRERYGYRGELRAVGQVLRDQLPFMHRCGFDAYEIASADAAAAWEMALAEIGVRYQPASDGAASVAELRRARGIEATAEPASSPARGAVLCPEGT